MTTSVYLLQTSPTAVGSVLVTHPLSPSYSYIHMYINMYMYKCTWQQPPGCPWVNYALRPCGALAFIFHPATLIFEFSPCMSAFPPTTKFAGGGPVGQVGGRTWPWCDGGGGAGTGGWRAFISTRGCSWVARLQLLLKSSAETCAYMLITTRSPLNRPFNVSHVFLRNIITKHSKKNLEPADTLIYVFKIHIIFHNSMKVL